MAEELLNIFGKGDLNMAKNEYTFFLGRLIEGELLHIFSKGDLKMAGKLLYYTSLVREI